MADTTELKPCPCCGGDAEFDRDEHGWHWIQCRKCGMSANQRASTMEDCRPLLAEAWNMRTADVTTPADASLAAELDSIADDLKQPYCTEIRRIAKALRARAVVPDESVESILAAYKSGLSHGAKQTDHEFEFAPGSASDKAYAAGYNDGHENRLAILAASKRGAT